MRKRELDRLLSELILMCDDMDYYHRTNGDFLSAIEFLYQAMAYMEVREYLRGNRNALRKKCWSLKSIVEEQKTIAERKNEKKMKEFIIEADSSIDNAEELIRCKDCIHRGEHLHCWILGMVRMDDDFCSCAERKKEIEVEK